MKYGPRAKIGHTEAFLCVIIVFSFLSRPSFPYGSFELLVEAIDLVLPNQLPKI